MGLMNNTGDGGMKEKRRIGVVKTVGWKVHTERRWWKGRRSARQERKRRYGGMIALGTKDYRKIGEGR